MWCIFHICLPVITLYVVSVSITCRCYNVGGFGLRQLSLSTRVHNKWVANEGIFGSEHMSVKQFRKKISHTAVLEDRAVKEASSAFTKSVASGVSARVENPSSTSFVMNFL